MRVAYSWRGVDLTVDQGWTIADNPHNKISFYVMLLITIYFTNMND